LGRKISGIDRCCGLGQKNHHRPSLCTFVFRKRKRPLTPLTRPVGNNNATPPPRTTNDDGTVSISSFLAGVVSALHYYSLVGIIWSFLLQLQGLAALGKKVPYSSQKKRAHHYCSFESTKKKKKVIFSFGRCGQPQFIAVLVVLIVSYLPPPPTASHITLAALWGWDFFRPPWKARAIRESDRRDEGVKNEHVRTSSSTQTLQPPPTNFQPKLLL
jgi:hypothetical protein